MTLSQQLERQRKYSSKQWKVTKNIYNQWW